MARRYLCPVCKGNASEFEIVYKLVQEVRKDEASGEVLFCSDELTALTRPDGRPDIDVRCLRCGYTGSEVSFARAAQREGAGALRR